MAKCKQCNATIPDGTDICSNCLDKEKIQSNESYLDSLLSSVKNSTPDVEEIYKKKNTSNKINSDKKEEISQAPAFVNEEDSQDEVLLDNTIDMKDFEDLFNLPSDETASSDVNLSDDELSTEELLSVDEDQHNDESIDDSDFPYDITALDKRDFSDNEVKPEVADFPDDMVASEENSLAEEELLDDFYDDEGSIDYEKLLGGEKSEPKKAIDSFSDTNTDDDLEYIEEENSEDEDILSLLNIISSEDPVSQDAKAIGEILSAKADNKKNVTDTPTVGEVFSDALKVVTSLNDSDLEELDIMDQLTGVTKETEKSKQKKEKDKINKKESRKDKKKDKKSRQQPEEDVDGAVSEVRKKSKKSLIKRIFGNVPDEKAALKKAEQESAARNEATADEKPKKGLKAKLLKDKKAASDIEDDENIAAMNKRAAAEAKKAEKKEKKKKKKEIIEVIDEIDDDESRINRIGASIVFIFFGLIAMLLIVGTNMISYSLSIQHAKDYFDKQKYNEAYNEVYGIDFKAEDMVIYDKIMTVMFVNKQLNSYNNYYYIGKYPEALDSLLKGLERYEKYIEFATMLGVKRDLDYVREHILAELKTVFNISEKEAMKLMAQDDMEVYSQEVYRIVLENINN